MSTIEFVVRGDAGNLERGYVAGADGASAIIVGSGQDISLNLQRGNILSYTRQGQALQITLVDGQVITIEGYFSPEGVPENELFISANGQLAEVELVAGEGSLLYAQYVDSDNFGKWSPDDDLYFVRGSEVQIAGVEVVDDQAGMLGTALLGGLGGLAPAVGLAGAGLGGALLLGGNGGDGTGGGDGDGNVEPPVVDIVTGVGSTGYVVNAADHSDGVEITGTGTPGATGVITVGGVSQNVTIDGVGHWSATFTNVEIVGGEYELDVSITVTTEGGTATATDTLVIDTVAEVTFDASTVETDGTVNFVEESDGFALSGTTQAGSTVIVSFGGADYTATVTGTSWVLNVGAGVIVGGEYDLDISVTATDQYGNTATTSDILHIDTVTDVAVQTGAVGGDGTVNAAEHAAGVTVNGVAEAGASVVVTLGAVSHTVTAGADGTWSVTYASGEVPTGTLELPVTAVSTDVAGNTATASGTIQIDTEIDVSVETATVETDGIINAVERSDGVTLTGTTEAGANVVVELNGVSRTVTADGSGNWSASWGAGAIPTGETTAQVDVTATDAAGNVATTSGTVQIDTIVDVTVDDHVTADGVVNGAEHASGVTLTGVTEAGANVVVTMAGVSRTVTADGSGNWTASWGASDVPTGETSAAVTVTATDLAGNTATTSGNVAIDTFVNRLESSATPVEGNDNVNLAEASDGITLNGVVEAGSSVMVTFEGTTRAATVDASGNWSVNFAASEIPAGEYEAVVSIDATDAAGNTASISDSFMVDTLVPDAPNIESYTKGSDGVRGIGIENTGDAITIAEFVGGSDAGASPVAEGSFVHPITGELNFTFDGGHAVPDGSHLVVTASDDAGNSNSTLFVLEDTLNNTVDATSDALDAYNIGAIDLEFAEDAELTLSVADIEAMSSNDNVLVIHGGADDTVIVAEATAPTSTTTIDGKTYDVYDVGVDGGSLIIDQEIIFNPVI